MSEKAEACASGSTGDFQPASRPANARPGGAPEKQRTERDSVSNICSNIDSSTNRGTPMSGGALGRVKTGCSETFQARQAEEEDRRKHGELFPCHAHDLDGRANSGVTPLASEGASHDQVMTHEGGRLVNDQQASTVSDVVVKEKDGGGSRRRMRSHPVGKLFDINRKVTSNDNNSLVREDSKEGMLESTEAIRSVADKERRKQALDSIWDLPPAPEKELTSSRRTARVSARAGSNSREDCIVPPRHQAGGVHTVEGLRRQGYSPEAVVLFLSGLHERTLE